MELDDVDVAKKQSLKQFRESNNMTDTISALAGLSHRDFPETEEVLQEFYQKWKENSLVVDKWLSLQGKLIIRACLMALAVSERPKVLEQIKNLEKHEAFNIKNPNKVRSLIGVFSSNQLGFHNADGSGYQFIMDHVIGLDAINPQVAAGLAKQFSRWRDFAEPHKDLMLKELRRVSEVENLSKNVYEIVANSLKEWIIAYYHTAKFRVAGVCRINNSLNKLIENFIYWK